MASADQIKALVKSHIDQDDGKFYSIAMQVAAHEAKVGHGRFAIELRDMVDAAKRRALRPVGGQPIPIARPRGEIANLLHVSYPANRLADMVLDDGVRDQLQRILKEQRMFTRIREHGLSPRRKLLLVGPPGTGKTMTASVLAGELGLPLFLVRLDALITKFMGETAAKLRQVFDAISEVRGVYFFDEFDAIGSQRGMPNDVGEIRRVLNSFLQMIEHDQSNSLIIAATNHPEILDYALFRRFDDVIEYHVPSMEQSALLLRARLGAFAPKPLPLKSLAETAAGLSYAELRRAVDEAIKEALMHDEASVTTDALKAALVERKKLNQRLNNKNSQPHAGPAAK
ncbi:AAA family ATPase [Cupriavidus taiwanensis]|uniref:Putative ATPase n=1 Tax=Cupriavidus taiwanensis TaxID=164546 RepID=A0A7Z7JI80_9BURK|nr:ATP-binding protein [Cupriavidus taiwanensis]SOZ19440.1 putative ATPase [Cupriavidus taiwanensis]SOZ97249.1 putative ATPase [Cupriavidus taiwanensis]SPC26138.1 putative ATPase [Cupriavidus taiwanensis]SPD37727.1 putative ATPase [Cupriavidus taiwanensis]